MRDVLTIKEAAEIASVTTQAIYQRLKKDLKPYLQYENGKKVLKSDVVKVLNKDEVTSTSQDTDANTELLQSAISSLTAQLATKDSQITALQDEVIKQNVHSREQSDKLIALVEQVNDLQKNNQILLKTEQDRSILPSGNEESPHTHRAGFWQRVFKKLE